MMFRSYSNTSKYFLRDYVTIATVVILVTMATPISSHVKNKNRIFSECNEDMIVHSFFFVIKNNNLLSHSVNYIYPARPTLVLVKYSAMCRVIVLDNCTHGHADLRSQNS